MNRNVVIAGQAGFSFGGFLFGQAARFGYNLVVARMLGAEALGIYALAIAVIQIAEVLAVSGLDSGVLRFVNLNSHDPLRQKAAIGSAIKTGLFFSGAVTLLLLLFSAHIASLLNGSRLLQLAICCYAAAIPFNVATVLFGHAIQGFRQLKPKIIATQVLSPFLLLLLTVLLRFAVGRDEALLLPFALAAAGAFFWIRPFLKKNSGVVSMDIVHARSDKAMLAYAVPFMAVSLLSMMTHWLDVMMLGMLTDTATVGLYHPAARTAGLLRSVLLAFAGIAAPMIAELHSRNQNVEIGRIYKMVTRWILSIVIPPAILFMVLPESVLGVFGARFAAGGTTALFLLTAASFMQATFGLSATVLAMTGYARLSLFNALFALGLQVGLNLLLIPRMGINGAALATLLVFLLLSALRVGEIGHFLKIHPFGKALWKPLVAALLTVGLLMAVRSWLLTLPEFAGLAAGASLSLCSYTALMLLLKLEEEEREIILKLLPFLDRKPKR
ncbi:MAG: polysaccharide biosynthesis protein [Chlorobium sp.]|nr:MAG: polysaccharide biosynthesis protein [Chlorobium sp.]